MPPTGSRRSGVEPLVLAYLALYATLLLLLRAREGFDLVEPLFVLLVVGAGFSLVAWWTSRGLDVPALPVRKPVEELVALAGWLVVAVAFITWGIPALKGTAETAASSARLLVGKVAVFVALPFLFWQARWGYGAADLAGRTADLGRCWRPVLAVSTLAVLLQLFAGQGPRALAALHPSRLELALGAPLAFLWLLVEVGLVEEFFFRALLQHRLAAVLGSQTRAVVIAALLFGLAHAPGLYLRPEATHEAVRHGSSLLMAVGYSVVITSTTGFFLGILWARTRNLAAVAIVHAAGDLVPNLPELLKLWHPH